MLRISSHLALSGDLISTSGSIIGTRPASRPDERSRYGVCVLEGVDPSDYSGGSGSSEDSASAVIPPAMVSGRSTP